jgi:hypothetical protein
VKLHNFCIEENETIIEERCSCDIETGDVWEVIDNIPPKVNDNKDEYEQYLADRET